MSRKEPSRAQPEFSYFEIQSYWGVTKHMGGLRATDELAALCHIDRSSYVLEVGCGVGVTSCQLARRTGCRLLGVDISDKMVEWARQRARRRSLEQLLEFRTADAQDLPFETDRFDAVICESVTAFPPDQQRAVNEYARVTRPGGYVGLNEGTWLKAPPGDLVEYIARTMANARFQDPQSWQALLENAGLQDTIAVTHPINALTQRLDEMQGLDAHDLLDRLRAIGSLVGLLVRNADFRRYAREITPSRSIIRNLFAHLGYGIYVGRKPPR